MSVLAGGAIASGALQTHEITASGVFMGRNVLGVAASPLANLIHGETVTLSNGTQVVYGGIVRADGIGRLTFNAQGNVQSAATTLDNANVFAASVSGVTAIKVGDAQYVLAASGTENGVSVWDVSNTGALTHADSLGIDDGLWIDAPTAMEVVTIGTQTYIVLASSGSSPLSVMALDVAGELTVTDHVIDSRNSRFASASALTIVEHRGNIYVIAGGADG
ncbi:MAG: serralysin [Candidatus Azotimanducaceae bacterium]|jgi:serralysin